MTVTSRVSSGPMNVLTEVSSIVIVTGCDTTVVKVAVGVTVLNIVMNPGEAVPLPLSSGGAPPEGSTTMVPGRSDRGIVMSPSPAVTVMILPPPVAWGEDEVMVLGGGVAVAEASDEGNEGVEDDCTRPWMSSCGGGLSGCGCACSAFTREVHTKSTPVRSFRTCTGTGVMAKYPVPLLKVDAS